MKRTTAILGIVVLVSGCGGPKQPNLFQVGTTNIPLGEVALLCFSNGTWRTVETYGYQYQKSPFGQYSIPSANGWTNLPELWCGTGAGPLKFRRSESTVFWVARPYSNNVFRFGVEYSVGGKTNRVWSEEIQMTGRSG